MSAYAHYSLYVGRNFHDSFTVKRIALAAAKKLSLEQPRASIELNYIDRDSFVRWTVIFRAGRPDRSPPSHQEEL